MLCIAAEVAPRDPETDGEDEILVGVTGLEFYPEGQVYEGETSFVSISTGPLWPHLELPNGLDLLYDRLEAAGFKTRRTKQSLTQ